MEAIEGIIEFSKDLQLQPFVNVKNLDINTKFLIKCFSKINTRYGEKVAVDCGEFRTILPHRFTTKFTEEIITEANKEILQGLKCFLISRGPVGQTVNVEIIQ